MKFGKKRWLQIVIWITLFAIYFNMIFYFSSAFKAFIITSYNILSLYFIFTIIVHYIFPKYYHQKSKYFILSFSIIFILSSIIVTFEIHAFKLLMDNGSRGLPPITFHLMRFISQFSLAFFVATSISLMEQTTQLKVNEKLLNEDKLKTELKLLKAQINPHFIFNALNNIYSLTYMQKQNAAESVLKLSEMLRYVFYDCNKDKVELLAEIKYIWNFIAFQQMKSEQEQNIKFQTSANIETFEVAPMLFIPFIENAFKYSKIEEIENAYVYIALEYTQEQLHFTIENSVPEVGRNISGSGLGIRNVKHRLEIIYKDKFELNINNRNNKYIVGLSLQL